MGAGATGPPLAGCPVALVALLAAVTGSSRRPRCDAVARRRDRPWDGPGGEDDYWERAFVTAAAVFSTTGPASKVFFWIWDVNSSWNAFWTSTQPGMKPDPGFA